MKIPQRIPLNLMGDDAKLAHRLRLHLEQKFGKLSAVQVARIAYKALAEKEKVEC